MIDERDLDRLGDLDGELQESPTPDVWSTEDQDEDAPPRRRGGRPPGSGKASPPPDRVRLLRERAAQLKADTGSSPALERHSSPGPESSTEADRAPRVGDTRPAAVPATPKAQHERAMRAGSAAREPVAVPEGWIPVEEAARRLGLGVDNSGLQRARVILSRAEVPRRRKGARGWEHNRRVYDAAAVDRLVEQRAADLSKKPAPVDTSPGPVDAAYMSPEQDQSDCTCDGVALRHGGDRTCPVHAHGACEACGAGMSDRGHCTACEACCGPPREITPPPTADQPEQPVVGITDRQEESTVDPEWIISSAAAAESGLTADYLSQLARRGQIESRVAPASVGGGRPPRLYRADQIKQLAKAKERAEQKLDTKPEAAQEPRQAPDRGAGAGSGLALEPPARRVHAFGEGRQGLCRVRLDRKGMLASRLGAEVSCETCLKYLRARDIDDDTDTEDRSVAAPDPIGAARDLLDALRSAVDAGAVSVAKADRVLAVLLEG